MRTARGAHVVAALTAALAIAACSYKSAAPAGSIPTRRRRAAWLRRMRPSGHGTNATKPPSGEPARAACRGGPAGLPRFHGHAALCARICGQSASLWQLPLERRPKGQRAAAGGCGGRLPLLQRPRRALHQFGRPDSTQMPRPCWLLLLTSAGSPRVCRWGRTRRGDTRT